MLTGRRFGRHAAHRRAADANVAVVRREKARDHPQQRGLAAAGRAEDREEAAVRDFERQRVDGRQRAVALADAVDLEIAGHPGGRDARAGAEPSAAAPTQSTISSPP